MYSALITALNAINLQPYKIDVPSTSMNRLQILQQLWITLMLFTTCCLRTWSRQHWP